MKDETGQKYQTVVLTGNIAGMLAQQVIKNATKVKSLPSLGAILVEAGGTATYLTPRQGENVQVINQKGYEKTKNSEGEL